MKNSKYFFLIMAALIASGTGCKKAHHEKHDVHWSYEGSTGPGHWGDLKTEYTVCKTGKNQSPIDITDPIKPGKDKIEFNYKSSILKVINNGHTIQVNIDLGSTIKVKGKEYSLIQLHFHSPSEGKIKGKHSDLVAHLVHKSSDGQLGVIGVYFDKGAENKFLGQIWSHLPSQPNKEETHNSIKINVSEILPAKRSYYAFTGSLTTPPCSENVAWMIMAQTLSVSENQIKSFTSIFPKSIRPIQPTNNREIILNTN